MSGTKHLLDTCTGSAAPTLQLTVTSGPTASKPQILECPKVIITAHPMVAMMLSGVVLSSVLRTLVHLSQRGACVRSSSTCSGGQSSRLKCCTALRSCRRASQVPLAAQQHMQAVLNSQAHGHQLHIQGVYLQKLANCTFEVLSTRMVIPLVSWCQNLLAEDLSPLQLGSVNCRQLLQAHFEHLSILPRPRGRHRLDVNSTDFIGATDKRGRALLPQLPCHDTRAPPIKTHANAAEQASSVAVRVDRAKPHLDHFSSVSAHRCDVDMRAALIAMELCCGAAFWFICLTFFFSFGV